MVLKALAIIIAAVLLFRLLIRFLLPILGKFAIKKVTENMKEQSKRKTDGEKVYQKGDIEIRKSNKNSAGGGNSDDEYVDYTEVE
ncbi:MAG: hypothetical protein Salg2KO_09670 [Salibacteraceae bacterium]